MNCPAVERYFRLFFAPSPDLRAIRALLTDDFVFEGPLLKARSADDYVQKLEGFGVGGLEARALTYAHHDDGVAVLYDMVSPTGTVPTTEWFWLRESKICRIRLLNDPRPFLAAVS